MAFPTHIVAAAGYVFDNNDNMLLVKQTPAGGIAQAARLKSANPLRTAYYGRYWKKAALKLRFGAWLGCILMSVHTHGMVE